MPAATLRGLQDGMRRAQRRGSTQERGQEHARLGAGTAQQDLCLGSKQLWNKAFDSRQERQGILPAAAGGGPTVQQGEGRGSDPESVVVAAGQLAAAAEKTRCHEDHAR